MCLSRKTKSWRGKSRGGGAVGAEGNLLLLPLSSRRLQTAAVCCPRHLPIHPCISERPTSLALTVSAVRACVPKSDRVFAGDQTLSFILWSQQEVERLSVTPSFFYPLQKKIPLFLFSSPLFFSPPQSSWEPIPVDSEESKWDEPALRHGEGDSRIYAHWQWDSCSFCLS